MKILLCLSSLPRNFEIAFLSLKKYVVDRLPVRPDIVASFAELGNSEQQIIIQKQLTDVADEARIVFEPDPDFSGIFTTMVEGIDPAALTSGAVGHLLQWHCMKNCGILADTFLSKKSYDWMIWARPDLFYFAPIENLKFLSASGSIYIPLHDHWWGMNDRWIMGDPLLIRKRMMIYDYFVNTWYKNYIARPKKNVWNPERVLLDFMSTQINPNVLFSRITFGKLRPDHVSFPEWDRQQQILKERMLSFFLTMSWKTYLKLNQMPVKSFAGQNLPGIDLPTVIPEFL